MRYEKQSQVIEMNQEFKKAKDIQVGDKIFYLGYTHQIMGVEVGEHGIVLRLLRHESPFVVRTWDTFGPETKLELV